MTPSPPAGGRRQEGGSQLELVMTAGKKLCPLIKIKEESIVMPNVHLHQEVVNIPNGTFLLAEGYQDGTWPAPQLCTVKRGKV